MAAKYSCKECGAELFFNPRTGKLHCEYCGSDFAPEAYDYHAEDDQKAAAAKDETIAQTDAKDSLEAAATDAKATDDSTGDLVVYKCPHCGAEVITAKETAATTCVYCNRAITLEGNIAGEFRPDYVLPFEKERAEVEKEYLALCRQSILTPRLFTKKATIEKIKGMYIPYWLYSFEGDATLVVSAKNVRTWISGDMEYVETEEYEVTEQAHGRFENIPADALKDMDNELMDSIEPFDFSKLKKFNPAYLAGFYTQRWDEDATTNEPRAVRRAKNSLTREAMEHVGNYGGGKSIRSEKYDWSNEKISYVMLPVWMMYTEYKGKKYIFGMNGQTGKMMGEIPKDPMRLVQIGAGIFIASQLVMMLLRVLGVM